MESGTVVSVRIKGEKVKLKEDLSYLEKSECDLES
jgi:hypothetical protein